MSASHLEKEIGKAMHTRFGGCVGSVRTEITEDVQIDCEFIKLGEALTMMCDVEPFRLALVAIDEGLNNVCLGLHGNDRAR